MTFVLRLIALLLFPVMLAPLATAQNAEPLDQRSFTCPLGGKKFTQDVGYSSFPLITLPDGSWLGDTEIGVQIPVCPDNGLVLIPDLSLSTTSQSDQILYAEYSAREQAMLPALIADPAYLALKEDGPYAQAWWLATRLDRPAEDRFFMLQRSTWATRDPAKRKQLVKRLADEGPAIIDALPGGDAARNFASIYIVNALRELGRFDEALSLLDRVEAAGAPIPEQPDPDSMFGPGDAGGPIRLAIAEKDDGRFAAELLPDRMVGDICENKLAHIYGPTTPATLAACKVRRDREQADADSFDVALELRGDKPALDRKCSTTPADKHDGALKKACEMRQDDRDQIAANELAKDGPRLAADCEVGRADERAGALRYACFHYDQALGNALGEQMAEDGPAFAIICPGNIEAEVPGRADFAGSACVDARWKRKANEEARLRADETTLDRLCATRGPEGYVTEQPGLDYEALLSACSSLESDRRSAAIEKLATVPVDFEQSCGRFEKTNSAGNAVYDLTEAQDQCRSAWRLRENTRAKKEAEGKGLACFGDAIYSPDRPECVTRAEYDQRMAPTPRTEPDPLEMRWLDKGSSLMTEAHIRAAAVIVRAKAENSYPRRKPGDMR